MAKFNHDSFKRDVTEMLAGGLESICDSLQTKCGITDFDMTLSEYYAISDAMQNLAELVTRAFEKNIIKREA